MPQESHPIVPARVLGAVFGALVALTLVTVVAAQINLGPFNVPLALAIAAAKAILVAAIFMGLRYDNNIFALAGAIGIVVVLVFLALTLSDTALRGSLGIMESGHISLEAPPPQAAEPIDPLPEAPAEEAPAPDGAAIFTRYLCNTCHSLDGAAGVGPTLQGIGGRQSGEEISASIRESDAIVAEGFPAGVMGATLNAVGFYTKVSDAQFDALVDYLQAQ